MHSHLAYAQSLSICTVTLYMHSHFVYAQSFCMCTVAFDHKAHTKATFEDMASIEDMDGV